MCFYFKVSTKVLFIFIHCHYEIKNAACLHFFALQNSPRAECQKIFEEWTKWSDFLIIASSHRSFISQILQDYHRQLRDLEKLLGGKPSESAENVSDR